MLDQSYYEVADRIIEKYGKKPSSLIPVMQDIPGGAPLSAGRTFLLIPQNRLE